MSEYPWKPEALPIVRESDIHPHVKDERADLFEAADGGSTEYEVLDWLRASIRLLKPRYILETGSYRGIGTVALASACRDNGFGVVHSLELNKEACEASSELLSISGLSKWATVHNANSLEWLKKTDIQFDFAFFDSDPPIRPAECELCLSLGMPLKMVAFHDTSKYRALSKPRYSTPEAQAEYRSRIRDGLANHHNCKGVLDSSLSRGIIALWFSQNDEDKERLE